MRHSSIYIIGTLMVCVGVAIHSNVTMVAMLALWFMFLAFVILVEGVAN